MALRKGVSAHGDTNEKGNTASSALEKLEAQFGMKPLTDEERLRRHDDHCFECARPIGADEPIAFWTISRTTFFGNWSHPLESFCMDCAQPVIDSSRRGFLEFSCESCKRIIRYQRRGLFARHTRYCSRKCRVAGQNKRQREDRREARKPLRCSCCGKTFTPSRKGRRYCSVACKQRAYRSRHNDTIR